MIVFLKFKLKSVFISYDKRTSSKVDDWYIQNIVVIKGNSEDYM